MIQEFKVINEVGESLTIELARPEKSGFAVSSIKGLGPVKATINTTNIATNDGGVYNSSRLSNRNIVIDLIYYPIYNDIPRVIGNESNKTSNRVYEEAKSTCRTVEDIRQLSYRYFPIKKEITLAFYTDNRSAFIKGYVESNEPDIFSNKEGASISIVCPYPYFKAIDQSENVGFNTITPEFEFEFSNEHLYNKLIEMGIISQELDYDINYAGDIETGIIMEIDLLDRVGDITIYNSTASEKFVLNASKIESIIESQMHTGDKIIINTLPREKSIMYYSGSITYNILNAMGKDSDWLTLKRGSNLYSYDASFGRENISFSLSYPILYEGI